MVKKIDLDFSYEVKPLGQQKVITKVINQKEVSKVLSAIKKGQRIRETEGPKFYGIVSGF
jgi:hypothetical protein